MIGEKEESKSNSSLQTADCRPPASDRQLPTGRQIWAEVDLQALVENYRALVSLLSAVPDANRSLPAGKRRIIPVIKADAYGHGMIPVARALSAAGATAFAVGFVDEGIRLRQAGFPQEILVLGTTFNGQETEAIRNSLTLAVDTSQGVRSLEIAARGLGTPASIHIKVDTGMARLGVRWDCMEPLLDEAGQASHVCLKGVFSHLSSADETDPAFTLEQIRRFNHSLSEILRSGLNCGEIHFANSAGLLFFEELRHWGARTGIALYGYSPDARRSSLKLRPALSLKTRVGAIRLLGAGEPIGYNRRYIVQRDSRITTLPVGYADGFSRKLSNLGKVIIQDRWAPVLGTVSMDMISIDLTDLPEVQEGDEVILLGSSAHCRMTADDWSAVLETIPYEVLCGIAPRVPRIFI